MSANPPQGNGGSTGSTPYPTSTSMSGSETQQRATETIDRLASRAHDTVDRVSAQASSMANRMGSSGEQYYEQTRQYMIANPMRALGIAVAAGFLLGRLLR